MKRLTILFIISTFHCVLIAQNKLDTRWIHSITQEPAVTSSGSGRVTVTTDFANFFASEKADPAPQYIYNDLTLTVTNIGAGICSSDTCETRIPLQPLPFDKITAVFGNSPEIFDTLQKEEQKISQRGFPAKNKSLPTAQERILKLYSPYEPDLLIDTGRLNKNILQDSTA